MNPTIAKLQAEAWEHPWLAQMDKAVPAFARLDLNYSVGLSVNR